MKLAQTLPLSLAALSLGSLVLCNPFYRAVSATSSPSSSTANLTTADLCLAEAKRHKIDRAIVGADYSTSRGIIEIDTASDMYVCRLYRGRVVNFSRSR